MYDMAKRSLAFTVATGGLLLTGTGYAPADAAVGFGTFPGPAQAQGSAAAKQASPTSVSTPISVRGPEKAAAPAAAAPKRDVRVLTPLPLDPRNAGSGTAASASSTVKHSGGILTGNTVQIPIFLGLNLCTNQANGIAAKNTVAGSTCGGSGAAGGSTSGASATSTVSHTGGILSGNTVQAPVNVPIEACGNQAVAIGFKNDVKGGTCGTGGPGSGGGANATAVTDHSGGILSGNVIQAPVNVPVNACGNQVNGVALKDKVGGAMCSTGSSGPGSGGASATAVTNHSGGIGSGLTIQTPINVPVNACGNQATAGGVRDTVGASTCSNSGGSTSALSATMNSGGIVSGGSAQVPINVPVNACGDQVSAVAVKDTTDSPVCTLPSPPGSSETSVVENSGGILSGNQPSIPINVPVNVCGVGANVGFNNTTGTPECSNGPGTPPPPGGQGSPPPSTSPSPSVPPPPGGSHSPSPSPTATGPTSTTPPTGPATGPATPPSTTPPRPGSLARTGGEEGIALAVGGAALLAGVGARTASRRRRSQR